MATVHQKPTSMAQPAVDALRRARISQGPAPPNAQETLSFATTKLPEAAKELKKLEAKLKKAEATAGQLKDAHAAQSSEVQRLQEMEQRSMISLGLDVKVLDAADPAGS